VASRADAASLAPGAEAIRRILEEPALASYLREVDEEARSARARSIAVLPFSAYRKFDDEGERRAFEELYFERRRALAALGLASWLWGRGEDLAALADLVWAICDEYAWALPAHLGGSSLDPGRLDGREPAGARAGEATHAETIDLFSAETGFALAEMTALLGGRLEPIVACRARREVERRVLRPFLARAGSWPWEVMRNNWCAVCAGSIGAAALYLEGDPERLDAILARVLPTLERFLSSFPEDGACLEGLGYWTYGLGFFAAFAELLGRHSGGKVDLLAGDKLRRIAAFQSKAYLTDRLSAAFADGSPRERYRIGLAAFLEARFPEAAPPPRALAAPFRHDHYGRWALSLRDLLWTAAEGAQRPAASEGGADGSAGPSGSDAAAVSWLPDAQWLVCPSRGEGRLGFAAKGGHNDEPHNHNDSGSFQLVSGNTQFIAELGAGEYTRDYFGEARYTILCASSLGHSLPIIDGRGQEAGGERRARSVECSVDGGRARLAMDIASAYSGSSILGLKRAFEFDGERALALRDLFSLAGPGTRIVERFVTGLDARAIELEEDRVVLGAAEGRLVLSWSPAGLAPRLVVLDHLDHEGRAVQVACIDFELPSAGVELAAAFEFRLIPR
jgi:hypothetical protein